MLITTAAGSLPGTDYRGALGVVSQSYPRLLPLPELPARGPGSQIIGRALALLPELGFELDRGQWRLASHPSSAQRRAQAQWRGDLDDVEELLTGFDQTLKVAFAGPWTLAGSVASRNGELLLSDAGAVREVTDALAIGIAQLTDELANRLPAATVRHQLDEPLLVAVHAGTLRTQSGLRRHPGVPADQLRAGLAGFAPNSILHCCAGGSWLQLAQQSQLQAVSVDAALLRGTDELDQLAAWWASGRTVVLGVVDTGNPEQQEAEMVATAERILQAIGSPDASRLIVGTACGMAGWQPSQVTRQLRRQAKAAEQLSEWLYQG
ncbi:MAG: hypothetical protein CSA64_03075 [Arachnia propionica]|nr:MAG: hypothetical protein CSA64_03075 [Arachnia propionica]